MKNILPVVTALGGELVPVADRNIRNQRFKDDPESSVRIISWCKGENQEDIIVLQYYGKDFDWLVDNVGKFTEDSPMYLNIKSMVYHEAEELVLLNFKR